MSLSRWFLGAALAAGLATAAPAAMAEVTLNVRNAGELAVLCSAKLPDINYATKENFCHGFAQGVFSSELERARAAGPGAPRPFCLTPTSPSRTTTLHDFVKWLDAHPAQKAEPPATTLVKFLGERLPCRAAAAPAAR